MYAHQARLERPNHLSPFEIVMGYNECHGRHPDCSGNDYAGTITLCPSDPLALIKVFCTAKKGK